MDFETASEQAVRVRQLYHQILVLAERLDVDIDEAYRATMDRIEAQLAARVADGP